MSGGITNHDGIAQYPFTAYFPGTGPAETTCLGCQYLMPMATGYEGNGIDRFLAFGRCIKWAQLRGEQWRLDENDYRHDDWWRGWQKIASSTPSCKYFEAI